MQREIVNVPVDPALIPEAAHKFARRALLEHERAGKYVMKAVEHIVKSGKALLKAYDLCEHGQWVGFFEMHFGAKTTGEDGTQPLTLRTAQRYMQLARDWSVLIAQHPEGFSSQRQAFKALAALASLREDRGPQAIEGKGAARCANGEGRRGKGAARCANDDGDVEGAARCANGDKPPRTGPVWRASGPFVSEALRLVMSLDAILKKLKSRGYPIRPEADKVQAARERLETMLHREIDEAEAQQAMGEWTFVIEPAPPADSTKRALPSQSEGEDDE
jgi:hypothetical protein